MFKYVHHVHYVVRNREAMIEYIDKTFGLKPDELIDYEQRGGQKYAVYNIGRTQIQLTEPLDPNSAMGKRLQTEGPGVWHVAWAVEDIPNVVKKIRATGTKTRDREGEMGYKEGPRGYETINIDPASSLGLWFQLAEAEPD